MARRPELVPLDGLGDGEHPSLADHSDTSSAVDLGARFEYKDGCPMVDRLALQNFMRDGGGARAIRSTEELFAGLADDKDRIVGMVDDFFDNRAGYHISGAIDGTARSLMVRHDVHLNTSDQALSIIELSAHTCDQFLGMYIGNLTILDPEEVTSLRNLAMQSYIDAGYVVAFYEHMIASRWLSDEHAEVDFIRYTRAAKKIMVGLIGDNDFTSPEQGLVSQQIAGGIAHRGMMHRLIQYGYGDDPGINIVEQRRAQLCLRALRATGDEFFVGIASPLDEVRETAYLKTAIEMGALRATS